MSAQTNYGFSTPIGAPGGLVDLAPHAIDSFVNEENSGVLLPGMGVVNGTAAGKQVKKPVTGKTAADFAGIVVNGRTTEYDTDGNLHIRKGAAVGVLRYGRIYGRIKAGLTINYGDPVYLIVATGNDAGYFTNVSTDNVAVKGRFLGNVDAGAQVAEIELFNQAQS